MRIHRKRKWKSIGKYNTDLIKMAQLTNSQLQLIKSNWISKEREALGENKARCDCGICGHYKPIGA